MSLAKHALPSQLQQPIFDACKVPDTLHPHATRYIYIIITTKYRRIYLVFPTIP